MSKKRFEVKLVSVPLTDLPEAERIINEFLAEGWRLKAWEEAEAPGYQILCFERRVSAPITSEDQAANEVETDRFNMRGKRHIELE